MYAQTKLTAQLLYSSSFTLVKCLFLQPTGKGRLARGMSAYWYHVIIIADIYTYVFKVSIVITSVGVRCTRQLYALH